MKSEPSGTIAYVARDADRALGAAPSGGYLVVSNDGPYARAVHGKHPQSVLLAESPEPLDTHELLERPETADFLSKKFGKGRPAILVFKSTLRIEEICAAKGWRLLNPPARLAETIENKITQAEWLDDLASLLPSFRIAPLKEIGWDKKPLVIQYAHAHTGEGTVLINSQQELAALQERFPDRPVKASDFVKGPVFTCNVCVSAAETLVGNISYQITGMAPFTDSPFATVGNDWSLPHSLLTERNLEDLREMAEKIGEKMRASGWKGLFGIDAIYDEERDLMKLIEINARQPASTAYESQLQEKFRGHLPAQAGGLPGSTIFEAHLAALAGSPFPKNLIEINDGAQIIQRLTKTVAEADLAAAASLEKAGYAVIPYRNATPNSDLLRIQSARGIMEKHAKFNARGEEIVKILK